MGKLRNKNLIRDRWLASPCFMLLAVCLFSFNAYAVEIDLAKIRSIESSNNPHAVSSKGCIGLYQISPAVLIEYNKFHKTSYTPSSLLEPQINERIAIWYLTKRIPQLLKHFKIPLTVDNILRCYNEGVGNLLKGRLPRETVEYLRMYNH